jgi:hypothetical protein
MNIIAKAIEWNDNVKTKQQHKKSEITIEKGSSNNISKMSSNKKKLNTNARGMNNN